MKKNLLIAQLQAIKGNPEIAIIDVNKMNAADTGEGTTEGVYPSFMVALMDGEAIPKGHAPWIALQLFRDDEFPRDPNSEGLNDDKVIYLGEEEEDNLDEAFGMPKSRKR